jgi:hypothetical protein
LYSVLPCLGSSRIDGLLQLQIAHPRTLDCRTVLRFHALMHAGFRILVLDCL